jgi:hypothetical protein
MSGCGKMVEDERKARALFDYLLKHRRLTIAHVTGDKISHVQLERAEKRFLTAFITNTLASTLILLSRLWGLSPADIIHLPLGDLIVVGLAAVSLLSLLIAWLAYFSIGVNVVVERAVEIKPRDD